MIDKLIPYRISPINENDDGTEEEDWQPMSLAPTDGTHIKLLTCDRNAKKQEEIFNTPVAWKFGSGWVKSESNRKISENEFVIEPVYVTETPIKWSPLRGVKRI